MFKLTPELELKSQPNDVFHAVRCFNGKMIIAGKNGSIEVNGDNVRLGEKFIHAGSGVIVSEGYLEEYQTIKKRVDLTAANLTKATRWANGGKPISSYREMKKKKQET